MLHIRHIGLNGIQAHVRSQRDEIGLEIALKVCLGIHFGGFGNIAALDIGDHGHTGGAHSGQRVSIGLHAVHAQAFVIGDLHFKAACHSLGGLDDGFVEGHNVFAGGFGRVHKILRQIGNVGVKAHAHRAAGGHGIIQFVHVCHNITLRIFCGVIY